METCQGSNSLLQEGAYAVLSGWDVVKLYEPLYPGVVENRPVPLRKTAEKPLPKVAETPAVPRKQANKKETAPEIAIDNGAESTYSVINKRPANLSDQENAILALLDHSPQLPDSVMDAAELPFGTVQSILTRLAIKGLVIHHPDGRISRK